MTLEEILKSAGLEDSAVKTALDEMKKNKIFTTSEENLDVRYGKLKTDHDSLVAKDAESQKLIAELQKANKGNEDVQNQIKDYQNKVQELETELKQTRINEAFKVAFATEGVVDVDYLMYKLKGQESDIKYDDNGNVSNVKELVDGLKQKCPAQFKNIDKKVDPKKLPDGKGTGNSVSKEQFNKMGYSSKVKFKQNNPELYAEYTK